MPKIIKASVWDEAPCVVKVDSPAGAKAAGTGAANRKGALSGKREETARRRKAHDEKATSEAMMKDAFAKKKEAEAALEEAHAAGAMIKADAEKEKNAILEDAHQQADVVLEKARSDGREEGIQIGREEGIAQIREEEKQIILDANAKAEKTLEDAKRESQMYVQQAEDQIAQMAMEIVEKILPQHFIDVPTLVLPLVQKALLKVKDQPSVNVRVSPDSYDLVLMARSEMQNLLEGNALLEVHSDENLGPGDVILETPNGDVDARLSTQLESIRKAIQDVMS
ncbi:MAG: flagellar assembly protein FliH [Schwartzia sp.]|nr:flagellar assembly protein FliH [Schwartzia sp. (in: firmicutes)]